MSRTVKWPLGALYGRIERTEAGRRWKEDIRYRAVLMAAFSFCVNLLYALYNGVLGLVNRSLWFLILCGYYVILSTARFCAVLCAKRHGAGDVGRFVMKCTGALLMLLSVVLMGAVYLSFFQNVAAAYDEIVMITIAAYTFYKITMAVMRAVRERRDPSPLLSAIRGIGYAEVAVSVLTLQRSMLVSFGAMDGEKARAMNLSTGIAVCGFVLALGICMLVNNGRKGEIRNGQVKAGKGK